jgi:hypothetical protein
MLYLFLLEQVVLAVLVSPHCQDRSSILVLWDVEYWLSSFQNIGNR